MNNYNRKSLGWLSAILIVIIIIVCGLPYLFTHYSILDFTKTGQIGDTIGGTMSPFVGILAAILTFMAFWIQYEANQEQRNSIAANHEENKEQQNRYVRERFESKLVMLLNLYKENVDSLKYANVMGKPVFKELLDELRLTYELVEYGYTRWVKSNFKHNRPEYKDDVATFTLRLMTDDRFLRSFLTETAYGFFFYGCPYFSIEEMKRYPGKVITTESIYGFLKGVEKNISENASKTFGVHVKTRDNVIYRYSAPQELLRGQSSQLGHYFRTLYTLAKYIDSAEIPDVGYNEKCDYFKMLRCQMSDDEQALLFYNSISPMGKGWNNCKQTDKFSIDSMGLIAKYRLIKNIPPRFPFFGINPMEYYQNETKCYEDLGKKFFEHESFYKFDAKVYVERNADGNHTVNFKLE